jgi:nucleoside 2-deoxyribosyltransferase
VRLYLAGPLFTDAERAFNAALAARLEGAGHRVFLPQRDSPQARGRGYAARIFKADRAGLEAAEAVVAVCDGALVDDGTAWEIGYACARGIPVIGLRTDVRIAGREERFNLMVQESVVRLVRSPALVLDAVAALRPRRASRRRSGQNRPAPGARRGVR